MIGFVITFCVGILLSLVFRSKLEEKKNVELICGARTKLTSQENGGEMYMVGYVSGIWAYLREGLGLKPPFP